MNGESGFLRDPRGAEGVNKILIVSLVAIPLILVLIFFGGEVLEFVEGAWQDLAGENAPRVPDGLFAPEEEEEEEEESQEEKIQETVGIMRANMKLWAQYLRRGGPTPPPYGTGVTFLEYRRQNYSPPLGDRDEPRDAWGTPLQMFAFPPGTPSPTKIHMRSYGADGIISTSEDNIFLMRDWGPDAKWLTADDYIFEDRP